MTLWKINVFVYRLPTDFANRKCSKWSRIAESIKHDLSRKLRETMSQSGYPRPEKSTRVGRV